MATRDESGTRDAASGLATEAAGDPLASRAQAFARTPSKPVFEALRQELRAAGRGDLLAQVCAVWAEREPDGALRADAFSEAGEALHVIGQLDGPSGAYAYLRSALAADATNNRAVNLLVGLYGATGRHAAALEVLELELAALAPRSAAAPRGPLQAALIERRAAEHRRAAELCVTALGRVDRALQHLTAACALEPRRIETLRAARTLHQSLGDDAEVARLYQEELDALGPTAPAAVRAAACLALGLLAKKRGDLPTAQRHLDEALGLDADLLAAREALAEVYASPAAATGDGGVQRASELFADLGRRRQAGGDEVGAIQYLRRALGIDPASPAFVTLEQVLTSLARWQELDRLYQQRTMITGEPDALRALLARRAELYRGPLADKAALITVLGELRDGEPPLGPASRELRELLRAEQAWEALATAIERELASLTTAPGADPRAQLPLLLELATVAREHLGDRERAGELLHHALSIEPAHAEALARYVEHFRERRDWRGLLELYEFALENARAAGAPADELTRRLEEIGQLAELRLGDLARAIDAWQRIAMLDPGSAKVSEALRRLQARAKMWEQLVGSLDAELARATSEAERIECLRRMAHSFRERQIEPRRAIAVYEQLLSQVPDDDAALRQLIDLYERDGDDAGVARSLRRLLDTEARKLAPAAPRDWPVAKRTERLAGLRRLALLAETRLADVDGVVFACGGVLEILPGDRDALDRLERVLDRASDPRLGETLTYHAAAATNPSERARVLRRLARLARRRDDDVSALEHWEAALRASPNDHESLEATADIYEHAQRWRELATVLERLDAQRGKLPEPSTPDAAIRAAALERYARVVDAHLADPGATIKAWMRVLELAPKSRTALAALAAVLRTVGRFRELADVLERQRVVWMVDAPALAAGAAIERAQVMEERLGAPEEAIRCLQAVIAEIDPRHPDAHAALRRLFESRGDIASALRIMERQLALTTAPDAQVALLSDIAGMARDRLGDPLRALHAVQRILILEPDHAAALPTQAQLQATLGRWAECSATYVHLLRLTDDPSARFDLMRRLALVSAEKLADPRAAFTWWRRIHDEAPGPRNLDEVRKLAELHGLWPELIEFYQHLRQVLVAEGGAPEHPGDRAGYVALSLALAAVWERRQDDRARAMAVLLEALRAAPTEPRLLPELIRLAGDAGSAPHWRLLLDGYELAMSAAPPAERGPLLRARAQLLEDKLGDAPGALAALVTAFSWEPDAPQLRAQIHRLAVAAQSWNEPIAVEAAIAERAAAPAERAAALRRKATVVEEHLKDAPRAFRIHLVAFLIAPDDDETVQQLWRLARIIGRYREADRTPRAEPAPALIQPEALLAQTRPPLTRAMARPAPRRAATEELDDADLAIGDTTQPLDLTDLEEPTSIGAAPRAASPLVIGSSTREPRPDATMELSIRDLVAMTGGRPAAPVPPRGAPGKSRAGSATMPATPTALPGPRKAQAVVRRAPLPQLPARAYDSPWEELAVAYEQLPATDQASTLRALFRAAEIWESGAKDIGAAFATLARAYQLARKMPSGDGEVRARLQRLAADHQAEDRLAELFEGFADSADTVASTAELLSEIATLRIHQGRTRDAETQLRRVLGMRPDEQGVRARLEELYRQQERWVELAASFEERTDPRLGTVAAEVDRPALLRELAAIYTDKLARPHDALDALERLRALSPADADVLSQIATLYGSIGRWSKVIEALARVAELTDGSPAARTAQHRIAEIYAGELELPDRAIETYERLIATWPDDRDAWAALDRLFLAAARWRDLAEVLRRRAALTETPTERAELLVRRADVLLDWLDAPDDAAAALRHARTLIAGDAALDDRLVAALIRAGQPRDAVALLEARIASGTEAGLPRGELAALTLRLAVVRAEQLGDRLGARAAVDEALRLVPEHPNALALAAQLMSPEDDPRAFVDAKLALAEAATDDDDRAAALMVAGVALRDRIGDFRGAYDAFQRVLVVRPFHADATWALAGLVELTGDPASAARLLESRLADASLEPAERARVLTQLASLSRSAGVESAAERRLLEALATIPGHLPAVIALADLYTDQARWDDLEAYLGEVTATPAADADGSAGAAEAGVAAPGAGDVAPVVAPTVSADLYRRRALALEQLGRDEDAYQMLLAADRLHRGSLVIKLALGENRYKARRWREAALHLAPLGSHDDATRHAGEVAQALYHAALAEIRSLRPEKAPPLYSRALELRPNFGPALQALAELAMEHGDPRRAADLLTRQANATDEPTDRLRLFEALGDMALMLLHDEERARVCYAAAIAAAQPVAASHVPLLEKLLERHDLAGDHLAAGRTAELMAAFGASPADRAARYVRAARDYLAAGEGARARAAADAALGNDAYDLDAANIASELALASGDPATAAELLGRCLSSKDDREPELRAVLAHRLGVARLARGDARQAAAAFERAIELAPTSDGAQLARRAWLALYDDHAGELLGAPSTAGGVRASGGMPSLQAVAASEARLQALQLEHLRQLAIASGSRGDVSAWSDELRRRAEREPALVDTALLAIELALAVGGDVELHQSAFRSQHPRRALRADEAYRGQLDAAGRALIDHGGGPAEPLAAVTTILAETAALLWPDLDDSLLRAGVTGATRVPSSTLSPAVAMLPPIASALGAGATVLYQRAVAELGAPAAQLVAGPTSLLVLSPTLLAAADDAVTRAQLARAIELARPERLLVTGLRPAESARLIAAAARTFGPATLRVAADRLAPDLDTQAAFDELLRTTLPVKLRARLEAALAALPAAALSTTRYLRACEQAADRAALLLGGDVATLVRGAVARGDGARHLLAVIGTPAWSAARAALGLAAE